MPYELETDIDVVVRVKKGYIAVLDAVARRLALHGLILFLDVFAV